MLSVAIDRRVQRVAGFTLIELLFGMAMIGILLALAGPSFSSFLQNAKLGTRAKSFYTGLQLARTEAIRQNLQVDFVLTDTPINTANIANVAATSPAGRNWVVRVEPPASAAFQLVEAKSAIEGGDMASLQVLASTDIISFNGTGGTIDGQAQQIDVSNPSGGLCAPAGPMRCWRVRVAPGGQVRLCDPAVTAAGDSRAC
ncbi:MAG TPA: GspH/FimT family pseudopilin [Candidatus Margulisiibacteriota bacterium]|nr:GspH/FimT family pseudopilin [Candidatus Margulisiibacteriota bacterium]